MAIPTPVNQVFATSETEAYVVVKNQPVYGTTDGGNTWTSYPYQDDDKTILQDLLIEGNEVIVSGVSTVKGETLIVYYSPDGGITWETRSPVIQPGITNRPFIEFTVIP